jgi:hypothetical protein
MPNVVEGDFEIIEIHLLNVYFMPTSCALLFIFLVEYIRREAL